MSVHKHNSWGRTRSPKNIAGDPGTAVTLEANTNNLLSGATGYKDKGYATENQRYSCSGNRCTCVCTRRSHSIWILSRISTVV